MAPIATLGLSHALMSIQVTISDHPVKTGRMKHGPAKAYRFIPVSLTTALAHDTYSGFSPTIDQSPSVSSHCRHGCCNSFVVVDA